MKKVLFLTLASGLILMACSHKANPTQTKTAPAADNKTAAATPSKPAAPAAPTAPVNPASATTNDLPAGPSAEETAKLVETGKAVYTSRCGRCHALKNTADYDANRWNGILGAMAPKAKLTDEETKQVKAYVEATCKK